MGSKAMTYEELEHFISEKMSLSHVYQPVAIQTLLTSNGTATMQDVAAGVSSRDPLKLQGFTVGLLACLS